MTIDREDILVGRVVDGEASAEDWTELEHMGELDPSLWWRLARTQRDQATLGAGLHDAIAIAEAVELSSGAMRATHSFHLRWSSWSGWAAAAAIALVWANTRGFFPAPGMSSNTAGLAPANLSTDEAFNQYLTNGMRQGRVLGELPTVMIDSQPSEDGTRQDITVLRRIIEVQRVHAAFRVGMDEFGRVMLVPAQPERSEEGAK